MTTFVNRMLLSAKLNADIYEEVEADRTALPQAMGVVILSSVAAGFGSLQLQPVGFGAIFLGTVSALLGWAVWRSGSLWVGMLVHGVYNATLLAGAAFSLGPGPARPEAPPTAVVLVGIAMLFAGTHVLMMQTPTPSRP